MTTITAGDFKGQRSWVLANDDLQVTILPDLGTKMASLVQRPSGREFLYQRADWPTLPQPPYGASFGDYDLSGFDEMFPTIDACRYVGGTWDGTFMPDHGEVWAVPWQCHVAQEELVTSVHGWRLPYRLEKRVRLVGASAVRQDYVATNLAGEDLHVLWAAHPLCACSEATRIVLPAEVTGVINTFPPSQRFNGYGARGTWPTMTTVDEQSSRLDVIGPASLSRAEKYWVDGPVTAGWGALHHQDTGDALGFAWTPATVPYLGIWVTEGGYGGHYHVALEPATAAMDRPDVAARYGWASVVPAYGTLTWSLTLAVARVAMVRGVTLDGVILT